LEWIDQRIIVEIHGYDGFVANPNAMKHLSPGSVFSKPIPHGVKSACEAVYFDPYFKTRVAKGLHEANTASFQELPGIQDFYGRVRFCHCGATLRNGGRRPALR
jgi:hypothetical protein